MDRKNYFVGQFDDFIFNDGEDEEDDKHDKDD